MSISDVILFYSIHSEKCRPCIDLIQRNNIPIKQIRLDTDATRDMVINGEMFKIEYVPTLVIIITDGSFSSFEGTNKVVMRIEELLKQFRQPPPQQYPQQPSQSHYPHQMRPPPNAYPEYRASLPETGGGPLYGNSSNPPRKKSRKQKSKKSKKHKRSDSRRKIVENYPEPEYDNETQMYEDGDEYGETELEFVESEPIDESPSQQRKRKNLVKLQSAFGGAQFQQQKGSGDIMRIAEQMRAERTKTLGYDEKDLPGGGY